MSKTMTDEERRAARRRFYEYCMAKRAESQRKPDRPLWENPYWSQEVLSSSPAECVVKLYDGAIQFLRRSVQAIEQGDVVARYEASQRAARIVEHLAATLDMKRGGEIAEKFDAVYKTTLRRMLDINVNNDAQAAHDAIGLLEPLARSWRELASRQAAEAAERSGRPLFEAAGGQGNEPPHRSISATV